MLLDRRDARRIWAGRKSRLRVPLRLKPPEPGKLVAISYARENPALGYGEDGLPRRESERLCRVVVVSVSESRPIDATDGDARLEGYRSLVELLSEWPGTDPTWLVAFVLDPETPPRYLSNEVVAGRQGDYTEVYARRLPGEGEPIDDFLLERYAATARRRHRERVLERSRDRAELPFMAELNELRAEARPRQIDIRDELRAIERWRDPRARATQLRRIRAKLRAVGEGLDERRAVV